MDVWARGIKYAVLAITVLTAYLAAGTTFCWLCPVGALFAGLYIVVLRQPPIYRALREAMPEVAGKVLSPEAELSWPFYLHVAILVAVLLAVLVRPRVWCRYLCPLGALAAPFNTLSLARVELDDARCTGCLACLRACPMGIDDLAGISGPECILCGRCVEACPHDALRLAVEIR